jgi:hypothetical protein
MQVAGQLYMPVKLLCNCLFCHMTGKAIGLPDEFLAFAEGSKGGGVIQVRRNNVHFKGGLL